MWEERVKKNLTLFGCEEEREFKRKVEERENFRKIWREIFK